MTADNLFDVPGACPACGMFVQRQAASHLRACLADPVIAARVVAAMDDGTGAACRRLVYEQRRALMPDDIRVPCGDVVASRFGGWDAAALALGLRPGMRNSGPAELSAPLAKSERRAAGAREAAARADYSICLHGKVVRVVQVAPGIVHEYILLR